MCSVASTHGKTLKTNRELIRPKVVYFQRKPYEGLNFSLEQIFHQLRNELSDKIEPVVHIANHHSRGILPRCSIIIDAARNQGDINHVTGDINFAAISLKKNRTILTILDTIAIDREKGLKKKLLRLFWLNFPSHRCAILTTISEFSKRSIEGYIGKRKEIVTIPVAIDRAFKFTPRTYVSGVPTVITVGSTENKNLERIFEAISCLQCRLIAVGKLDSKQLETIERLGIHYENYQNVTTERLVGLYKEADVLAFCSTYEGFGMPVIEAQAVGTPVVTSNVASLPEVAGDGAVFVDPYSVDAIRNGIVRVLTNESERRRLIIKGIDNAKKYTPEGVAHSYYSLYRKILSKNQANI